MRFSGVRATILEEDEPGDLAIGSPGSTTGTTAPEVLAATAGTAGDELVVTGAARCGSAVSCAPEEIGAAGRCPPDAVGDVAGTITPEEVRGAGRCIPDENAGRFAVEEPGGIGTAAPEVEGATRWFAEEACVDRCEAVEAAWNKENAEGLDSGLLAGVDDGCTDGLEDSPAGREDSPVTMRFTGLRKISLELDGLFPSDSAGRASPETKSRVGGLDGNVGGSLRPQERAGFDPHNPLLPPRFKVILCSASTRSAADWNRSDRFFSSSVRISFSSSFGISGLKSRTASGR